MSDPTALFKAIKADDVARLETELARAPDLVGATDDAGNSPLLIAIYHGKKSLVEALLKHGARPSVWEAAAAGLTARVTAALAKDPEAIHRHSHDGWTLLHLAAFFGHAQTCAALLDAGAPMLAVSSNREGNLPINAAAAGRHADVVRLLLKRGCPPDAHAEGGSTAFQIAQSSGDDEIVVML